MQNDCDECSNQDSENAKTSLLSCLHRRSTRNYLCAFSFLANEIEGERLELNSPSFADSIKSEKLILCDSIKIPQSFFCSQKNDSSLYKGAFDGQGRALSLRYDIIFTPCEVPTLNFTFLTPNFSLLTPPITFHSTKKHPKRVLFVTYLIIFQLPFRSFPPYEERGSLGNPLLRFRGF